MAVPVVGILLTFGLMHLPALRGQGEFSSFAPIIATCLVALPVGLFGLVLAAAALIRRERWIPAAVVGVILNLLVLGVFLVFILDL